jgi:hypothetical protein
MSDWASAHRTLPLVIQASEPGVFALPAQFRVTRLVQRDIVRPDFQNLQRESMLAVRLSVGRHASYAVDTPSQHATMGLPPPSVLDIAPDTGETVPDAFDCVDHGRHTKAFRLIDFRCWAGPPTPRRSDHPHRRRARRAERCAEHLSRTASVSGRRSRFNGESADRQRNAGRFRRGACNSPILIVSSISPVGSITKVSKTEKFWTMARRRIDQGTGRQGLRHERPSASKRHLGRLLSKP